MDSNSIKRLLSEYGDEDICNEPFEKLQINQFDEKIVTLIQHQLQNGLSMRCTANTAKLLNSMPNSVMTIPENPKSIQRRIKVNLSYEYIVICECKSLVKDGEKCSSCGSRAKKNSITNNYVVSIPLVQQIKSVLSTNYEKIIKYLNRERKDGVVTDVDDGSAFKNIASKYPNAKVLGLTVNIDGANFHRSSKSSLWLTQIYQNYLPPNERYRPENVLIVSLYYGAKKPDPFNLVSFLAQELENCEISIFDGHKFQQFVPAVVIASCDLPARAILQCFKGPVGYSACPVCYEKGVPVLNLKNKTTIRYVKQNDNNQLRTHDETVQRANAVITDPIDGVKGHSCMFLFDYFDVVDYFAIDFMHGIALGVAKDIIEIWLGMKKVHDPKNNLKIRLKNVNEKNSFNQRVLNFKPLMHFRRKPRSILDISTYKATEVLNFLLYYSRFALLNLLSTQVTKHYETLSAAIFILCKSKISTAELEQASNMLIKFADNFEIIYGKGAITMNVHLIRHYGRMVQICGPLWSTSLFGFESNIGAIKKFVCGTTGVLQQIAKKYVFSKTYMSNECNAEQENQHENLYQPKKILLSEQQREVLSGLIDTDTIELTIYRRLKTGGHTYTCMNSNKTKAADFFLEMLDGTIGTAEFYFKDVHGNMFVLLNKYEYNFMHFHIKEVTKVQQCLSFPCNQIKNKWLYLSVGAIEYISEKATGYFV